MEDVKIPIEIARRATACKEVLDTHTAKEHAWIRSAQVDFNFWCSTIKATSFDQSGMDYRLRNYQDARESICNLLDALKSSVEGAVRIYNGAAKEFEDNKSENSADDIPKLVGENDAEAPGSEEESEDSDSTMEFDEVQSFSKKSEVLSDEESVEDNASSNSGSDSTNNSVLEEYISYVRTILDQLTRISLTIRRDGAMYRVERADKALKETEEVKAFRQHLTTIINSEFPDKDAEGLSATEKMKRVYNDSKFSPVKLKLIRANILRRHRIEYFTKARAPKTRASMANVSMANASMTNAPIPYASMTRTYRTLSTRRSSVCSSASDPYGTSSSMSVVSSSPQLPCEFYGYENCEETFDLNSFDDWVQHICGHHLRWRLPRYCICWFCDDAVFHAVDETADEREHNYRARMHHIADHFGHGATMSEIRPDFYFLDHLRDIGLVSERNFQACKAWHEAPLPKGGINSEGPAPDAYNQEMVIEVKYRRGREYRRRRLQRGYSINSGEPAPIRAPNEIQIRREGEMPNKTLAVVDNAPPTSIISSKVKENQPVTPITPQVHEAPVERARSIYTAAVTATDVGSNFDTTDLSTDKAPSRITKMTKIRGLQAYPSCPKPQPNGTLICPYCNDELPDSYARNEQSWKAHVARDILPYSCIMGECSNDDEMYVNADHLLVHMRTKHSSTKWTCNPCSINTKQASKSDQPNPQVLVFFDSAESWQAHTEKEHGNLGPAPQRDILTELSKRQLIGPLECPLCKSEPTLPSTGIDGHILKHLHEFALRALPQDTESDNEKERTIFQASDSASLLSYTKDSRTANVGTPNEGGIDSDIGAFLASFYHQKQSFGLL